LNAADGALRLENQLCFALYAASRAVIQAYQPLLKPLGITYPQYLALLVLWEGGSPRVGEIGERLDLDSATLTPMLKRMEKQGLLARDRQTADQRQVRIRLTPAGKRLKSKAVGIPHTLACRYGAESIRQLLGLRDSLHDLRGRVRAGAPATA